MRPGRSVVRWWLCRRARFAYQLGYLDGWDDGARGRERRDVDLGSPR